MSRVVGNSWIPSATFAIAGLVAGAAAAQPAASPAVELSPSRQVPAETTAAAVKNKSWKAPRTSWGHPSFEGVWSTDDMRGVRIEVEQDTRPPSRGVADAAELLRDYEPVVEQGARDRRYRRRREIRPVADLDACNRPEPTNRVHHMEAIDRAHQFGISGFHRAGVI